MLRRVGWPAELAIGVRPEGTGLAAHAWVTIDGVPIGESLAVMQRYTPFADIPDGAPRASRRPAPSVPQNG
jgi:hypothetical protein